MEWICQKHTAYMNIPYHVSIYCCLAFESIKKSCEVSYTKTQSVNKRLKHYVRKWKP